MAGLGVAGPTEAVQYVGPGVAPSTHSPWEIIAHCLELGKGHGESLSPCADPCSHFHREIQHLRDPEGAECQEHNHRCAGKPAQLGAGFHVVSLTALHSLTPWYLDGPTGKSGHLGVLWDSSPSPPGPMSTYQLCLQSTSRIQSLPFISGATSQVPATSSLHPGLLLQSASCNLFSSRQPKRYF